MSLFLSKFSYKNTCPSPQYTRQCHRDVSRRRDTKIPHKYLSSNFANSSKTLAHDLVRWMCAQYYNMYIVVVMYHYVYCLLEPRDGGTIDGCYL